MPFFAQKYQFKKKNDLFLRKICHPGGGAAARLCPPRVALGTG